MRARALLTAASLGLALGLACDGGGTSGPDGNGGPTVVVFASGLINPQGLAIDAQGNVFVGEQGTGNDDARISVITPAGVRHTLLDDLPSVVAFGNPGGVHHLLLQGSTLWAVQGLEEGNVANLLRIELAGWSPGDPPLTMADDVEVEELGPFIVDATDANITNLYNIAVGYGGDLFLVDAAANVVIRRVAADEFQIFAPLPDVPNTSGIGAPMVDPVPTGIAFDDGTLLVSAFTGFPFNPGAARIFAISAGGVVTEYRTGLTSAVDLKLDPAGRVVVAEYGSMFGGNLQPDTGRVLRLTANGTETLVENLNTPTGIAFASSTVLYVSDMSAGNLLKVTF